VKEDQAENGMKKGKTKKMNESGSKGCIQSSPLVLSGHDSVKMVLEVGLMMRRRRLLTVHVIQLFLFGGGRQVNVYGMDELSLNGDKTFFFDATTPVPVLTAELGDIAGVTLAHFVAGDPQLVAQVLRIRVARGNLHHAGASCLEGDSHLVLRARVLRGIPQAASTSTASSSDTAVGPTTGSGTSRGRGHARASPGQRDKRQSGSGLGSHGLGVLAGMILGRSHGRRNRQRDWDNSGLGVGLFLENANCLEVALSHHLSVGCLTGEQRRLDVTAGRITIAKRFGRFGRFHQRQR
jgi:hypothetical protein